MRLREAAAGRHDALRLGIEMGVYTSVRALPPDSVPLACD
jgi:hypothetical protein